MLDYLEEWAEWECNPPASNQNNRSRLKMNYYPFLALLILGFFFLSAGVESLGFILLVLALLVLFYALLKSPAKNAWKEIDATKGSYPEGKFTKYTELTAKKFAEYADEAFSDGRPYGKSDNMTKYNAEGVVQKIHPASKNFFAELKDLFK